MTDGTRQTRSVFTILMHHFGCCIPMKYLAFRIPTFSNIWRASVFIFECLEISISKYLLVEKVSSEKHCSITFSILRRILSYYIFHFCRLDTSDRFYGSTTGQTEQSYASEQFCEEKKVCFILLFSHLYSHLFSRNIIWNIIFQKWWNWAWSKGRIWN